MESITKHSTWVAELRERSKNFKIKRIQIAHDLGVAYRSAVLDRSDRAEHIFYSIFQNESKLSHSSYAKLLEESRRNNRTLALFGYRLIDDIRNSLDNPLAKEVLTRYIDETYKSAIVYGIIK